MNVVLAGVLGYVLLQLLAGVVVSRRIRNEADYLLAGRRLGLPLAAFSIFAPDLSERDKIRIARTGVFVGGVIAYVLALHAEGVYALVQESSAFGGAGIFIIVVFGLFTRIGGAHAAGTALVVGIGTWLLGAYVVDWPVPYLVSLASAAMAYLVVAAIEHPHMAQVSEPA